MSEKPETAKIEFEVAAFAVDFLKDYLAFLNSDKKVETVAVEAFWEEICRIRDDLPNLTHYDSQLFSKKYPDIYRVSSRQEIKREEQELEKQNDC
jgi:hypothetical protein